MTDTMKAKITVLSPVHVGSGAGELLAGYDFVADNQFIHVIDHERMFQEASEEAWQGKDLDVRIPRLLSKEQYRTCSRYSMRNPGGTVDKIVEHIKDSRYCPYIPGSSLKGAIRTGLAYAMMKEGVTKMQARDMGRDPRRAASYMESKLFGANPNRDMMRALQVVDTPGVQDGAALSDISLYTIRDRGRQEKLEPKGPGYSFTMEVIPAGTELEFPVKLDSHLLRDDVSQKLSFGTRKKWLQEFPRHCNTFAEELIRLEINFYKYFGLPRIASFYTGLESKLSAVERDKQFLLQIAWGTGWSAKTVGEALDNEVLAAAMENFRLGKRNYDIFPKTRRLVVRGNVPETPMGWIRVDMT